jgi:xanthine dehydrogenase accessory factor
MFSKLFWEFASTKIEEKGKIALLIVAQTSESSPGREGFKMIVTPDGATFGTIGGGIMEKNLIDFARKFIDGKKTSAVKTLRHSKKGGEEASGLICGGTETVVFKKLTSQELKTIKRIILNLEKSIPGKLSLGNEGFSYRKVSRIFEPRFTMKGEKWQYMEQVGFPLTAYVVGGGHVGLAVSRILKTLDFRVIVFDERKNVFTLKQNKFADEIIITKYSEVGNFVREGKLSYVIIVTPKHTGDAQALYSLRNKKLAYIGSMGSKKKIETIFRNLKKQGVSGNFLNSVHAPIGVRIKAETPEEIAVSIAGEIIKIKNTKSG